MTKHKLFKLGAAAALTVTGVSAITSLKTVRAANFTAIKRVKINYLPGKGLNIWTNYNKGKFMGYRAKDGTIWNVAETAVDKKGNLGIRLVRVNGLKRVTPLMSGWTLRLPPMPKLRTR